MADFALEVGRRVVGHGEPLQRDWSARDELAAVASAGGIETYARAYACGRMSTGRAVRRAALMRRMNGLQQLGQCYGCARTYRVQSLGDLDLHVAGRVRLVSLCGACVARCQSRAVNRWDASVWQAELWLLALATPDEDATEAEVELHHKLGQMMRSDGVRRAFRDLCRTLGVGND